MANYIVTDTELTGIANAIRTKGGTNASLSYPDGFVSAISAISTGGGKTENDVTFYDYDGTIIESYSATDFANLSALPANPTHSGLTAQGWNWSLSDAKTYVSSYGKLNIGQMYITDDGKTRLYIHIENIARNEVPLYWQQTVANGVNIDWGDGSPTETFDNTGKKYTTHTYTATGNYIIKFTVTEGKLQFGHSLSSISTLGAPNTNKMDKVYLNYLRKVEIGTDVTAIDSYAFSNCGRLSNITIPNNITNIGNSAFYNCISLSNIIIPNNVTLINASAFSYCYFLSNIIIPNSVIEIGSSVFYYCISLSNIIIPNSITKINSSTFAYCSSLSNIIIPSNVTNINSSAFSNCSFFSNITIPNNITSIGSSAFSNCSGIKEYHLLPTVPPTLSNTNTFSDISEDCIIYVPSASLETYKTAEIWSTYASYMVGE